MKQLLDFLPLVVFFGFYKFYDILTATKALIVATAIAVIYSLIKYRKVEKMMLVTFVMVLIFGTLTIKYNSTEFIKWKVTVIYGLFAGGFLFSQFALKKIIIKNMLGKEISLPDAVWSRLNISWALFFLFCGLLNIYIAFWHSLDAWMNFKVFGLTGMTFAFTLLSGVYIYRNMAEQEKNGVDKPNE
ncbi:septation protein A [Leminorella grimontii]|uniref:septation protein A n=1 Tax=Leminorella grimontii TaxID=82981 RepID=UPI00208B14E2|nr:septation protein A [Leminorella grimontii]GKX59244.1 putative intracellular septation protein A [Leminorella grimontii]